MDVHELSPGLRYWVARHPERTWGTEWPAEVGAVSAVTPDALVIIDPQIPEDEAEAAALWRALDDERERARERRVEVLLTVSWHARSSAAVAERYRAAVWCPPTDAALPAGVEADVVDVTRIFDTWCEAAFYLPEYRTLFLGDLLAGDGRGGILLAVDSLPAEHREWARTELRERLRRFLEWPITNVVVSHGEPVLGDGHAALERALARDYAREM